MAQPPSLPALPDGSHSVARKSPSHGTGSISGQSCPRTFPSSAWVLDGRGAPPGAPAGFWGADPGGAGGQVRSPGVAGLQQRHDQARGGGSLPGFSNSNSPRASSSSQISISGQSTAQVPKSAMWV